MYVVISTSKEVNIVARVSFRIRLFLVNVAITIVARVDSFACDVVCFPLKYSRLRGVVFFGGHTTRVRLKLRGNGNIIEHLWLRSKLIRAI